MEIIRTVEEMRELARHLRKTGHTIAFVPTMGYLHAGHVQLLQEGKKRGNCLVLSIYVNPIQFGAGEDFEKYPRDPKRDAELADTAGVDIIFCPENRDMYPDHYQTFVNVVEVTQNLCGHSRPGHFRGVTTVCCKLFNIVAPHTAIFGKKDFQQLATIRRMVHDLNLDLEIVGMPTVREADGLAMSSRNTYLQAEERTAALSLSQSLLLAKKMREDGEHEAAVILRAVMHQLGKNPLVRLEYAKICDVDNLSDLPHVEKEAVLALAARIGRTRLIDNYIFGEPLDIPAADL